jgi:hypothetical protein
MSGKGAGPIYLELTGCRIAFKLEARIVTIARLSFWQQDRNWQIEQQRWSDQLSTTSAVSSVLTSALTNQSSGLAAISNRQALLRVTQQLKTAATSALQPAMAGTTGSAGSQVNKVA